MTYTLEHGGWSYHSYLKPVVYRTATMMSAPQNIRDRRQYEAPEDEYDVYPAEGKVVFHAPQEAGTYVYVTLGNDYLRSSNAANALCLECHVIETHKRVNCAICHGTHGTGNLYGVRDKIGTPHGYSDVVFRDLTSMGDSNGVCTVCHTTTMYHNVTALSPVEHYDNRVCVDCHPHRKGFPSFTTVFNPIKRKLLAWLGAGEAYAKPPAWVTDGALPPGLQNHSLPEQAWANGLKKFKVNFEIVRKSASQESSQGAIKDDIIQYYHNDHLGQPLFLTDEVGSIVWRREQTPFGVTSFERGTTTESLRFPGQYYDPETGLHQNWHRDYAPGLGRYVEADPIGQSSGVDIYGYVAGNPSNRVDIFGLDWDTWDFVDHYYHGGGMAINLADPHIGLLDNFQNAASVKANVAEFKALLWWRARKKAQSLCRGCSNGRKTCIFSYSNSTDSNVINEPGLWAVGNSTFFRKGNCSLEANCGEKSFSYSCRMNFYILDTFSDPAGIDMEAPRGTPYDINADWAEKTSGKGTW